MGWPTVSAASESDFTIEDGVLKRYNGSSGDVVIPNGVTEIDGDAFFDEADYDYYDFITSISIPASVTDIWNNAFDRCANLKSVIVDPENTEYSSEDGVLYDIDKTELIVCPAAKETVTVPASVTYIYGDIAYRSTNLKSIIVDPQNTEYASEDGALYDKNKKELIICPAAKESVTLPASVTSVDGAFDYCAMLKSISVNPKNTKFSSENGILYNKEKTRIVKCPYNLKDVILANSITAIDGYAFHWHGSIKSITIPNSVTEIGENAFSECYSLEKVSIPDSVKSIGSFAFSECYSLKTITIPKSVTSLDDCAFIGCTALTGIEVSTDNKNYSSINGVLYDKNKRTLVICPGGKTGSLTIPDSVTSFAECAFVDCSELTGITIPKSVNEITNWAFEDCTGMTKIEVASDNKNYTSENGILFDKSKKTLIRFPAGKTGNFSIPNSVTTIGDYAFYNCEKLKRVTIPDSVTSIGDEAFYNCSALTSIIIPKSVRSIGLDGDGDMRSGCFAACEELKDVYYTGTKAEWKKLTAHPGWDDIYNPVSLNESAVIHYNYVPITITAQPANASGNVNGTAKFSVKAEGEGLTYQWYLKKASDSAFTAWNKKTAASVSTPIYASWNKAQLYCLVKDGNGNSVKSNTVTLTVTPKITAQPANASGKVNDTAKFSLTATGSGLTYQWYVRKATDSAFTAWNKKTSASVSTPIYASWNKAQFYCVVKDANGKTVKSNTVTLTVTPKITTQPASVSGAVNGTAKFSLTATGSGLTYQWYVKKASDSSFTAWNKKTSASVSTPIYASWNNTQFYCIVKDGSGKSVKSNTVTLTVTPKITQQPANVSGAVNGTAKFSLTATGAGLTYQWYYKKSGDSAFTAWNKRTSATASTTIYKSWDGAQFYCVVKDGNGKTVKSSTVTLTVK